MPFDCFLNAYNANRYSSISLTERGVFDFLETLVYQLTSLEEIYIYQKIPVFPPGQKRKRREKKRIGKISFRTKYPLSLFLSPSSSFFLSSFFLFQYHLSNFLHKREDSEETERGISRRRRRRRGRPKKWTEEVEEDVNVSCSAPRNGSMILASRGVWAARRTSIVGPSPLKERRKGRSRGPGGGGGGSRGGGGSGGRPGASHGARRESRREEVSILRDTPRARSARAHTGWLNNFIARKISFHVVVSFISRFSIIIIE